MPYGETDNIFAVGIKQRNLCAGGIRLEYVGYADVKLICRSSETKTAIGLALFIDIYITGV